MPVNTLSFVSDFGKYPLDTIWPPSHPRYGESTIHMLQSGEWTWGAQPTNRSGTINYNDALAAGASILGVTNDPGTGAPIPTCTAWDFQISLSIDSWPPGGATQVVFLQVQGRPNPPYVPATGPGLAVGFNRAGNFFTVGQLRSHTESTGLTFTGGTIGLHLEVTPKGPWWLQISVNGALARTYCGDAWGGGELFGASWGVGSVSGGSPPNAVLKSPSCSGTMGAAASPVECPHAVVGGGQRAWALWWPE